MKKLVPLADILWHAANLRLSIGSLDSVDSAEFSCCAAYLAERGIAWRLNDSCFDWPAVSKRSHTVQFLKSLGCKVGSIGSFNRFELGEERQGVRYMWLLLAMHVAEDEEIMVEVDHAK